LRVPQFVRKIMVPSVGLGAMAECRFYVVDTEGRSTKPAVVMECADHEEAISRARQYVDTKPVVVWEGAKCVAWLDPGKSS
jgi:hypothetical protein